MMSVRTAWISDVHLGSRSCQADALLRFLDHVACDQLYLLGDIIDVVALKRSVHWPDSHTRVMRKLIDISRSGTRVTYLPGNHDDVFRTFAGSLFDNIRVRRRLVHSTADGKRLLLLHGDEMDAQLRCGAWFGWLGNVSYRVLMRANHALNAARAGLGLPYWSLAATLKERVDKAVEYMELFERGMVDYARRANVDGVVCGHIHFPALKEINGTLYCNDGDWVDICSALVELPDGQLQLLRWADMERQSSDAVVTSLRNAA